MNTDTLVPLLMSYCFWVIKLMKNVNNFQMAKIQPQGVAYHLLDFFPISAGVAYKSVAYIYKKACRDV